MFCVLIFFIYFLTKKNMSTCYQPSIIKEANEFVELLEESGFFKNFEIKNKDFAVNYFCDKLTEKFIEGVFQTDEFIFTDEEFDTFLNEIIVGSALYELEKEGIVDSIEDENCEKRFFLTDKGKEIATKIKIEHQK
jgi:hypothetical protein